MALKVLVVVGACAVARAEVISDLLTSSQDEHAALEIKAEKFWKSVLSAAQEMHLAEHLELASEAERVLAQLPQENDYVRQALRESVDRLQRADRAVLSQATDSSKTAAHQLAGAPPQDMWSFLSAGQNFLSKALRRFVDGGEYSSRLLEQVQQRQADILPILRGASSVTGDVLTDCRLASKRAFDVLKYDLYNKGVPKTPEAAKAVAHRLADAAGETRHRFMRFITEAVQGITRDAEGKHDSASATVMRSAMEQTLSSLPASTGGSGLLVSM